MAKQALPGVMGVGDEFARLAVDPRLGRRLRMVVTRLAKAPDLGFPRALVTERECEGFYRLLANRRLTYAALVDAHARQTVGRMSAGTTVRVIHDTTELSFGGDSERKGLGRTRTENSEQGFFAHVSLAVTADAVRRPLGVVASQCWARKAKTRGDRKLSGGELAKLKDKESDRWTRLVAQSEEAIGGRCSAVHLMDREGDSFTIFDVMVRKGSRFVVRMAKDRTLFSSDHESGDDETLRLSEALVEFPAITTRTVPLGKRRTKPTPGSKKTHPARVERNATLTLSAGTVTLKRPRYLDEPYSESLSLNVVYVRETDPPANVDPVSWVLLTTEPVGTVAEVEAVVDHYRARWLIEEFFKAVKTGCAFEERQLESFDTLTKALAIFFPIAWQMLALRALSREAPDTPAEQVLTAAQIQVLRHEQDRKMPATGATVLHALYAVAGMGGHLKNNGPPGWRSLSAGMQTVVSLALAWEAGAQSARNSIKTSDQ